MKLELRGITKRFGPLVANDSISISVESGQIHALLGENGAGKSTLMNVLYGLYDPDEGEIFINDEPMRFNGPGDAVAAGIGMVHQHFMLVPVFTVAESVALGYEPTKGLGMIDIEQAREKVREVSARFNFDLDPDALIEDLPVGAQQRVEIVKALSRDARILILDEPTAVLTPQETDELMAIMKDLAAAGTAILFITHKLREVKEVASEITVIRRGKVVGTAEPSSTEAELASLMVGRTVELTTQKDPATPGASALRLEELSLVTDTGAHLLDEIDLDIRAGEIVGLAGVQGNGQTELAEVILGLREATKGKVWFAEKDMTGASVRKRLDSGLGFVPEDRSTDGMISSMSISENLILDQYYRPPFARKGVMSPGKITKNAEQRSEEFDIRLTQVSDPISTLSGGNQQKVVVAREMSQDLNILVVNQPTRGVDVGSIEFIHKRIVSERDAGVAVLLVSSELDEVVGLSDRIAVMYRGKILGIVPPDTSREVLGLMMAGVPQEEALAGAGDGKVSVDAQKVEANQ